MSGLRSFLELEEFLHTRGKPVQRKKIQNNTWAERWFMWGDWIPGVQIRLHDTPIIRWLPQQISLSSGGWRTTTTANRLRTYLPEGAGLRSDRGHWRLKVPGPVAHGDWGFVDGMTFLIYDTPQMYWSPMPAEDGSPWYQTDHQAIIEYNQNLSKLIGKMFRRKDHDWLKVGMPTQCAYCQVKIELDKPQVLMGDLIGEHTHLMEHLMEGLIPSQVLAAALWERGYSPAPGRVGSFPIDLCKRAIRRFLMKRLSHDWAYR